MDGVNNIISNRDDFMKNILSPLDNKYVSYSIILFLIIYTIIIIPILPNYILKLFDNKIIQFIIFFLIIYTINKNIWVSLMGAIAIIATLNALSIQKTNESKNLLINEEKQIVNESMINNMDQDNKTIDTDNEILVLDNIIYEEVSLLSIPEYSVNDLNKEIKDNPIERINPDTAIIKTPSKFYPQYQTIISDSNLGRYSGTEVKGFDNSKGFASI